MKIIPIFDRVVLEDIKEEKETASGFLLANTSIEKPLFAKVVSVSCGGQIDGKEIVMQVKVGDKVIYSKFAGSSYRIDGKDYVIVRQQDILAIID
ncbi:MAG: co-chaperone GroES [Clostridia bacterium]